MDNFQHLQETMPWLMPLIIILMIWEAMWKMIAMWRAARNNHLVWFICIAVINTVGILPIIYILMNRPSTGSGSTSTDSGTAATNK